MIYFFHAVLAFDQRKVLIMDTDEGKEIRIQILAAKEGAGDGGRAVAVARERMREIAAIGRGQGATALLVCPAPEEFSSEGIDLVVAARFGPELDQDAVFWRQHSLSDEIYHALRVQALVLDLDSPLGDFLKHMEPMLASPYRDEIGSRDGDVVSGI
jgi:hypothetical protein